MMTVAVMNGSTVTVLVSVATKAGVAHRESTIARGAMPVVLCQHCNGFMMGEFGPRALKCTCLVPRKACAFATSANFAQP